MWSELEREGLKQEARKAGANKSSEDIAEIIKPSEFLLERLPHLDPDIDMALDEKVSAVVRIQTEPEPGPPPPPPQHPAVQKLDRRPDAVFRRGSPRQAALGARGVGGEHR